MKKGLLLLTIGLIVSLTACLFLASDMGRHVKGQVIRVCNGAFL